MPCGYFCYYLDIIRGYLDIIPCHLNIIWRINRNGLYPGDKSEKSKEHCNFEHFGRFRGIIADKDLVDSCKETQVRQKDKVEIPQAKYRHKVRKRA